MKSLGNFPDPFIEEISGQPEALRRAAAAITEQRPALETVRESATGRTVVFTGMGSSYDACYPAVIELARAGAAAPLLNSAELVHFRSGMLGSGTLLVAISQSGESAEVVRLVGALKERDPRDRPLTLAVTNGTENRLASLADLVLDTRAGREVGPSTMTFAAAIVVLAALARVLAGRTIDDTVDHVAAEAERAAHAIERLVSDASLPDELARRLGDRDATVLLGRGPARAAAEMGALTIKEAVGIPVESLETAQFRHGPLELAGPGLAAMVIATEPETLDLDLAFANELAEAGASVLLVTCDSAAGPAGVTRIDLGAIDRLIAPAASVVPAQLLAWRLAALRGREPGAYRRASKVTTRE